MGPENVIRGNQLPRCVPRSKPKEGKKFVVPNRIFHAPAGHVDQAIVVLHDSRYCGQGILKIMRTGNRIFANLVRDELLLMPRLLRNNLVRGGHEVDLGTNFVFVVHGHGDFGRWCAVTV